MNLLETKTAELKQAKDWDDVYNVLASAFEGQSAKPLYDQLVAGDFNGLQWRQFANMCDRITKEEDVPWTDIHEYILVYIDKNEQDGGYNFDAVLQAA